MGLVNKAVTDVRLTLVRKGLDGEKWGWTDAGWGGDWLGIFNAKNEKLLFNDMKMAYLAQGPCLTDVRYHGFYGAAHEVAIEGQVQTFRTDDYARTLQNLKYTFQSPMKTGSTWFYQMGAIGNNYKTPMVCYGNRDGLIAQKQVQPTLKPNEWMQDPAAFSGAGPWWVAFPGGESLGSKMADGYRGLVIRSYKATFGGKTYTEPTFSLPVYNVLKDGVDVISLLVPPKEVTAFQPGDTVEMQLESVSFPRIADDYYGSNEAFRTHLKEHPNSWKTIYREAAGNDLKVTVDGGTVVSRYPIVVQAEAKEVTVRIHGGVGFVPIRFERLKSADQYLLYNLVNGQSVPLDQSVYGNDFWQTDYDQATQTYGRVYNLPLDGQPDSVWILRSESPLERH